MQQLLVTEWLKNYLLKEESDPGARAIEVTEYFSSHKERLSHGRPITLATIKDVLKIRRVLDLKDDPELRELVGELWAEVEWFVESTGTDKFFENAYGVGFRRTFQQIQQVGVMPFPFPLPQPQPPQTPPQPPQAGPTVPGQAASA